MQGRYGVEPDPWRLEASISNLGDRFPAVSSSSASEPCLCHQSAHSRRIAGQRRGMARLAPAFALLMLAVTAASAQSNSSSGQCDPTGPRVFCGRSCPVPGLNSLSATNVAPGRFPILAPVSPFAALA